VKATSREEARVLRHRHIGQAIAVCRALACLAISWLKSSATIFPCTGSRRYTRGMESS
jgi:hypothetical protein